MRAVSAGGSSYVYGGVGAAAGATVTLLALVAAVAWKRRRNDPKGCPVQHANSMAEIEMMQQVRTDVGGKYEDNTQGRAEILRDKILLDFSEDPVVPFGDTLNKL